MLSEVLIFLILLSPPFLNLKINDMINRIKSQNSIKSNVYNVPAIHVSKDLALTPSQMLAFSEEGIPISSNINPENFNDGDNKPLTDIHPILSRGVDIVDVWDYQKSCRSKLLKAQETDINNNPK